jgi:hypothetical protein
MPRKGEYWWVGARRGSLRSREPVRLLVLGGGEGRPPGGPFGGSDTHDDGETPMDETIGDHETDPASPDNPAPPALNIGPAGFLR